MGAGGDGEGKGREGKGKGRKKWGRFGKWRRMALILLGEEQ